VGPGQVRCRRRLLGGAGPGSPGRPVELVEHRTHVAVIKQVLQLAKLRGLRPTGARRDPQRGDREHDEAQDAAQPAIAGLIRSPRVMEALVRGGDLAGELRAPAAVASLKRHGIGGQPGQHPNDAGVGELASAEQFRGRFRICVISARDFPERFHQVGAPAPSLSLSLRCRECRSYQSAIHDRT
jgi:hypothetical protein